MFKRMMVLVVLISILLVLMFVKSHTASPVHNTSPKSRQSTAYITQEYTISKISGNQYFGEAEDGTGIQFSGTKISSREKIQVHDKVICYFDKNDLGQGIVKVEKK